MATQQLIKMCQFGTPPDLAVHKAKKYIEFGADVNCPIHFHNMLGNHSSIIYIPIQEGHIHMLKLLFENGSSLQCNPNMDVSPLDFAIKKWYGCYRNKVSMKQNNTSSTQIRLLSRNIAKYRKIWPSDDEVRSYKIAMFLIKNKGQSKYVKIDEKYKIHTINTTIENMAYHIKFYDAFIRRQKQQRKVDVYFAFIINTKTNTNIGTQLIQILSIECDSYLSFHDISFGPSSD